MPDNANLYATLERSFAAAGTAVAFTRPGMEDVTYRMLAERVARMANALTALGVRPGDRVLAQIDKSLANVELYLATLKVGAAFNPLNTAYTVAELDYFVGDARPALVVVPAAKLSSIEPIAARYGVRSVATMEADGSGSLSELAAQQAAGHETAYREADDLAALLYTSGTTGRSKGAMITHRNLASNAETLRSYWEFEASDILLHALPIFHVHGLFTALNTALLAGARIIWLDRFDVETVMRVMPEATVMMGVPTFYTRLLGHPAFGREHCRHMRLVISGSAPLLAETHQAFEARTGLKILERYGMTEAQMITSNPTRGGERVAGTVGYALPGISVRTASQDGTVLPPGEVGVLEVKGPNVFKGYWQNPEKTQAEFRPDGYFITGDLATIAADGRVTIVGRAKDLIISGGFNVYPKEIEDELNSLPGVVESAVIGVPHPDFGEGVVAVLTADPGSSPPREEEIMGRLAERLAKFKLPKRIFVVDELPRNAMGKVQKAELRARYGKTFAA